MHINDFDYDLPKELIAQRPLHDRDRCRLMVLDRDKKTIEHRQFTDILDYLRPGRLSGDERFQGASGQDIWHKRKVREQKLNFSLPKGLKVICGRPW